jgi:hypothetical protein
LVALRCFIGGTEEGPKKGRGACDGEIDGVGDWGQVMWDGEAKQVERRST